MNRRHLVAEYPLRLFSGQHVLVGCCVLQGVPSVSIEINQRDGRHISEIGGVETKNHVTIKLGHYSNCTIKRRPGLMVVRVLLIL